LVQEAGWEFGQNTGVSTLSVVPRAMGWLGTAASQDLGLTSLPGMVPFDGTVHPRPSWGVGDLKKTLELVRSRKRRTVCKKK
jgi:hypothetical protein